MCKRRPLKAVRMLKKRRKKNETIPLRDNKTVLCIRPQSLRKGGGGRGRGKETLQVWLLSGFMGIHASKACVRKGCGPCGLSV